MRRVVQGYHARGRVGDSQTCARFDRGAGNSVIDDFDLDDVSGARDSCIGRIGIATSKCVDPVTRCIVVQ